jgi:hypothetical protein
MQSSTRAIRAALAAGAVAGAALLARPASAQIKEPGAHYKYSVELEPQFVVQWAYTDWDATGIGAGLRASIPVIANGPITTINNSLAVGFGFDWAHVGDTGCALHFGGYRDAPAGWRCSGTHLWFPVVAQWNFFFTPVVSAFGELGIAVHHSSYETGCTDPGLNCGQYTNSYTNVAPMFAVGPRFALSDAFAITLRLGVPYLTIGASFLL